VLLLYIQYRVAVRSRKKKLLHSGLDKMEETKMVLLLQQKFIVHASHTCTNYVMFVWAIVFTKGFQGVHCIQQGQLVLGQDLAQVYTVQIYDIFMYIAMFSGSTLASVLGISVTIDSNRSIPCADCITE